MNPEIISYVVITIVTGLILTVSNFFILKFLGTRESKVNFEMLTREVKVLVKSLIRMNGWGSQFEKVYNEEWDRYENYDERKKKVKDSL